MRSRTRRLGLFLGAALTVLPMAAWAQTTIAPDTVAGRALGTAVGQAGTVFTIDGGTLAGANLFHSFSQFSLGRGDTAQWTRSAGGAASVSNVISRVTGGQASQIAGTLDSTGLPNANFFFINPAGIVFSEGARVNVPAAAHFSTAADLRFVGGARFAVATPNGSTLSMAAPESFGFVGGQGAITVTGVGETFTPAAATLSLTASNVRVTDAKLALRGFDAVAVGGGAVVTTLANPLSGAGSGAVTFTRSQVTVTPVAGRTAGALRVGGGDVRLTASTLNQLAVNQASGPLTLLADRLTVTDSFLNTLATGTARGSDVNINASDLTLSNSSVSTQASGAGRGGDINIIADDAEVDGGFVTTLNSGLGRGGDLNLDAVNLVLSVAILSSNTSGRGAGGEINVTADDLLVDFASISSNSSGSARGGDITLAGNDLEADASEVLASADDGSSPGDVYLLGERIFINGGSYGSGGGATGTSGDLIILASESFGTLGGFLSTSNYLDGSAGGILIQAPDIFLQEANIQALSAGAGDAGAVIISGDNIVLDESVVTVESSGMSTAKLGLIQIQSTGDLTLFNSTVSSSAYKVATGGFVLLEGKAVELQSSVIDADTFGDGDGGLVSITADTLHSTNTLISSDTINLGTAGGVVIDARTIALDTGTKVSSDAFSDGNAGAVVVTTSDLLVEGGSSITSKARGGRGNAGDVTIDADSIFLRDASFISSDSRSFGRSGQIRINTDDLLLDGGGNEFSYISSDALGDGAAGGVTITAKDIGVFNGASISSNAFGFGNAGKVLIEADTLEVRDSAFIASDTQGDGNAGDVTISVGKLVLAGGGADNTFISSDTLGGGNAGFVTIDADSIEISEGAFISSDSYVSGEAGDVSVTVGTLKIDTFGSLRSGTFSAGDAGDVSVVAGSIDLQTGGSINSEAFQTSTSTGNAGLITIVADDIRVGAGSRISTASAGEGDAGALGVDAGKIVLDGGLISSAAEPTSKGASGALFIAADELSLINGGSISTVSNNPKMAGQIEISAGSLSIAGDGSAISSENQGGNVAMGNPKGPGGDAGSIAIEAESILIADAGRISTNSFSGAAGSIDIVMPTTSLLTLRGAKTGGSIETSSGAGTGGKISISSPLAVISNGGGILALGERRGANVVIASRYFIGSSDRTNTVAVDGEFRLVSGTYDVSSGTVSRDLSVLDASKVLRGQCPAARSTGVVSQLVTRPVGPYVREPAFGATPKPAGARPLSELRINPGSCS